MPIHSTWKRADLNAREVEKNGFNKSLSEGTIKMAQTEWAALSVLSPKENGSLHFCDDLQKENAVTKWKFQPKERIDECIHSPGVAAAISTLAAKKGYSQVEIEN